MRKYAAKQDDNRRKSLHSVRDLVESFFQKQEIEEQLSLQNLWSHWSYVVGDELKDLAFPLGHKDRVLYIGAEDNMALQEISFYADDILKHANAFMGSEFFQRIRLELMQGRSDLSQEVDFFAKQNLNTIEKVSQKNKELPSNLGSLCAEDVNNSDLYLYYKKYVSSYK